jgi:predicted PurR-regulated permease PerM
MNRKSYQFNVNGQNRNMQRWPILTRILVAVFGLVGLVLAFMFSIVLLAIAAVLILVLTIYFWWKTRHLRKRFRDVEHESRVIDGESRRDD